MITHRTLTCRQISRQIISIQLLWGSNKTHRYCCKALGRLITTFVRPIGRTKTRVDALKLVSILEMVKRWGYVSMESAHMNSMGARNISRLDFEAELAAAIDEAISTLPVSRKDLLA